MHVDRNASARMTIGSVGSTWALPFILLLVAVLAIGCVFFAYLCQWRQRAPAPDRRTPDHLPDTGQAQHLPPRDDEVEGRGAAMRREDAEAGSGVPARHAAAACDGAPEVLVAADALLAERPAEALPLFARATRLAPDCAAAWSGVASAQVALLQPDEALAAATRTLQLAPDDAAAWCSQSWALGCLRRYKPALVAAQHALALAPDDPSSWETQANALYCLRRYQEAVTSYEHALALAPERGTAWDGLADAQACLRRFDQALAAYEQVTTLDPTDMLAWANQADMLMRLRRSAEAVHAYDHALALDPDFVPARQGKDAALRALGHPPTAP